MAIMHAMFRPLELSIGLRYTRAKRRNHFISFISMTSMIGVALGVMALIVVLSVMNGFENELRGRILGMTAHASVVEPGRPLRNWESLKKTLEGQDHVLGIAPFIQTQAMLTNGAGVQGALISGVLPSQEPEVSVVAEKMVTGNLTDLEPGKYNIILGYALANSLQARVGDKVTIVAPQPNSTPAGIVPRLKRFNVVGIFEVGMNEYDASMAIIHIDDAGKLFKINDGVTGIRLKLDDMFNAPRISRDLVKQLPGYYGVIDWTQYHTNFFKALKTEQTVMFVILTLIVAVAAFNIVSTLVMVVTDKQADVAILRTLGMAPRSIMWIFMVQGVVIGLIGTLLGILGGVALALNVENIVPWIENTFQTKFMEGDVYLISNVPSDLQWEEVMHIGLVAFVLCLLATIYPAWRAARTQPAEALRYE